MPVFVQIKAFALTLLFGILMGLVFHYYLLIVRRGRVRRFPLYFFDLIIWIIILLAAFISLLIINQGEMRVYVLLAMACGVGVYFKLFAGIIAPVMTLMADATIGTIGFIKFLAFKPIQLAAGNLKKIAAHIRKVLIKPPPGDNKE
ncbi:MAG: spore cortex biosynthesis protein YabQ [Syntrophomonadaceae bacterium]